MTETDSNGAEPGATTTTVAASGRSRTVTATLTESLAPLRDLPDRLAGIEAIGTVSDAGRKAVAGVIPPGSPANSALAGSWLGHPLHPLLTDMVIGSWSSAAILDFLAGRSADKAARKLVGVGLLASLPTLASGLNDWSTLGGGDDRVGAVHGAANALGTVMMAASYHARRKNKRLRAKVLILGGLATVSVGGYLGGDLSYRRAAGVDQAAVFEAESEWTEVAEDADVSDGDVFAVRLGDMDVMLTRQAGRLYALADRCSHQGGPLHEGKVADGCVTCPWHDSRFRLSDGRAESGPTAHPQRVLQTRVTNGKIELRQEAA